MPNGTGAIPGGSYLDLGRKESHLGRRFFDGLESSRTKVVERDAISLRSEEVS